MADSILLRVLTEAGVAIEDHAVSIVAPGEVGYLGVLRNHAPLVTTLTSGLLTWRTPGGTTRRLRVTEGLLEVTHNRLTVLTKAVTEEPSIEGDTRR
jgi:F-type H+-transporting ATPase subunit epsilon